MRKRIKPIQLIDALDRYYETVSRFKKSSQQEYYRISTLKKSKLSEKIVSKITSVDIADYRDFRLSVTNTRTGKKISPNTVRLELALLSSVFNVAKSEWGACLENPVVGLRKPKLPSGRTRRLAKLEELKIKRYFLNKDNVEAYSIFIIAIETAMRQGEILSLHWRDVSFKKKIIVLHDTKNGDSRTIPLTDVALDVLKKLKADGYERQKVFSYTSNGFKSAWRSAILALNIQDLHFHDLRHEAISRFVELGTLNLLEVAAISGHKSMSMLKRYTHIDSGRLHNKINKKKKRCSAKINFCAYHAYVSFNGDSDVDIEFIDLELKLNIKASMNWVEVVEVALLRYLVNLYSNGITPPSPSVTDDNNNLIDNLTFGGEGVFKFRPV